MSDGGGDGSGGAEGENPITSIFDVFMTAERRHTIRLLQEADEPIAIADLAHELAALDMDSHDDLPPFAEVLRARNYLYHVHVPRLADEGVVEYDDQRNTIEPGPAFETFADVLRRVDELGGGE